MRDGVTATVLVGHDYAVSVVQELLARRADGALAVDLEAVHLLNGGLYPDVHRPQPIQLALLDPEQGPQISSLANEDLLSTAGTRADLPLRTTTRPRTARAIWGCRQPLRRPPHLVPTDPLPDSIRQDNAERWTGALESTDVPLAFVWGMLDPISGAHMAERIRERCPGAASWRSRTWGTGLSSRRPTASRRLCSANALVSGAQRPGAAPGPWAGAARRPRPRGRAPARAPRRNAGRRRGQTRGLPGELHRGLPATTHHGTRAAR